MRIAIAQLNTQAADFASTVDRMLAFSRSAAKQGADLLVFPLPSLCGCLPVSYESREGFLLDLADVLAQLSDGASCPCVVPAVGDMDGESMPEAMFVHDGEVRPLRLLSYMGSTRVEPAREAFDAGISVFEHGGLRFGLAFTYEEIAGLEDSDTNLDVLLYLPVYGYALDDASTAMGASLLEGRFRHDAATLDAWVVGAAGIGGYGTQVFTGSSFVLTPAGDLVASAPAFEEALVVADVATKGDAPSTEYLEPELYDQSLHLWEVLSMGVHDFVCKQGKGEVALALDAGLGSALLLVLACDAMGPTHVHALLDLRRDAPSLAATRELARALHVDVHELSGSDAAGTENPDETLRHDLFQAHLAALARRMDALVLSAEDKTFLALEVETAGCSVADLLPFGDVYRTDLIELAHLRNTISPVMPAALFDAYAVPQVAGLAEEEPTREAQLRRVDVTLSAYIEWERSLSDLCARQGDPQVTQEIVRELRRREAARVTWLPYLIASTRTLFDARMPLGMSWQDRPRAQEERMQGEEALEHVAKLLGSHWHDTELSQGGTMIQRDREVEDVLRSLTDMGAELSLESLPEGISRETVEQSLAELFGLLRDLMRGGTLSMGDADGRDSSFGGPFGPMTWGSPFSEN